MKRIKTENANILEVAHGSKSRAPNNCDVPEWRCFMHKPLSYTHSRADMKHELFFFFCKFNARKLFHNLFS